jgi:2-methylcitrate dehydratase PrpD
MCDGREFREEALYRRGSPENPLKPEEVVHKFRNIAGACLANAQVDRIVELTEQLDRLDSVEELATLLGARY